MFNFLLGAEESGCGNMPWLILVMVIFLAVMYLVSGFFQKKQKKADDEKLKQLKVGDKVLMSCGIIGNILRIDEVSPVDTYVLLETGEGDNKSTMTFDIRALYMVIKPPQSEVEEPAEEQIQENAETAPLNEIDAKQSEEKSDEENN